MGILVVEDDVDTIDALSEFLTLAGHRVKTAQSAEEALELAPTFPFDVALIDLGLPGLSGDALAPRLRTFTSAARQFCLIALTGYPHQVVRERTEAAGFDLLLSKPVSGDALEAAIASCRRLPPRG